MSSAIWQYKAHSFLEISPNIWRCEPSGKRHVGLHLVGTPKLFEKLKEDKSIEQALQITELPGVLDPVLTMPDIHQGYGFPIGGVAAFRKDTGVVSPGGVGYDINCGVRLLKTPLRVEEVTRSSLLSQITEDLFDAIPCGVGSKRSDLPLSLSALEDLLSQGSRWAVQKGYGVPADAELSEDGGSLRDANPDLVSARAKERGLYQLGTLGSGNHFVEIQVVEKIFDDKTADAFGLFSNQIVVLIHSGSRGLGYQTCEDYLDLSILAAKKYGLELPNRELAAAPLTSSEGQNYLGAMMAAANYAFANRQIIGHWVREVFVRHFPKLQYESIELLYDVCHNIAKWEEMDFGRGSMRVCVHRKGATRAYPPKHPALPASYREVGQPVLVPGDMGRQSFVMAGNPHSLRLSFGSACHGAGRELSRTQAKKLGAGRPLLQELREQGIFVKVAGRNTAIEEMPEAYKDVSEVTQATESAGIARLVVKLRPLGGIKG